MAYTGFPRAGIQFLIELEQNNNKAWFEAHKKDFKTLVQEPALEIVSEVGSRLQTISPEIHYDLRTNGAGSLIRINRDVRFSEDKTPYKTNIAMMFWQGTGKKFEHPGFGMQMNRNGAEMMAGLFSFSKPLLESYREVIAVDKKRAQELESIIADIQSKGEFTLSGSHYKRVPRGYNSDHPRAELLKHNGLWMSGAVIPVDVICSPDFVDELFDRFVVMAPIQQWLVQLERDFVPN